ncbi:hypothetical protein AM588_10004111 [Phytophthora nicotianae]|uniref:Neutral zinc metallopeptidase n=1 Tax=Phytophthora nicotianae TaxID=4792 RepID=A0A0W8CT91_PHYNI|nr:hypothetical protein AM588_10004111 [Phytophthora nicotianae]
MTPSTNNSLFSTKNLFVAALTASVACRVHAAEGNNSTSVDHATFGDITSGSGKCVTGNPNKGGVTRDQVDWVWENTMSKYVPQFNNLIFDQLVTNKGKLNYCVRWDNDLPLTKATASKFQAMLEKQINLWNHWLVGYGCWPQVHHGLERRLAWYDLRGLLDAEGSPKCPDECYKHQNQAASADTSGCKGNPFDMSLWPSTIPGENAAGTGGDWGQRVQVNDMLNTMDQEQMRVLLHEIGHGFGLPEMYLNENKPSDYPVCVMDGEFSLTDGDGWLLRSILEKIKSRYNF